MDREIRLETGETECEWGSSLLAIHVNTPLEAVVQIELGRVPVVLLAGSALGSQGVSVLDAEVLAGGAEAGNGHRGGAEEQDGFDEKHDGNSVRWKRIIIVVTVREALIYRFWDGLAPFISILDNAGTGR